MGFLRFWRRSRWDDERRREIDAHVAIETDDNLARGLSPDDARARAVRSLGNPTLVREEIYRMNTIGWLETAWQDVRYGGRLLRRSPGFTCVALLSLALGIGANAALFQLLDVIRLRSLPVRDADALTEIRYAPGKASRTGAFIGARPMFSNPLWEQLRDQQTSLDDLFAYGGAGFDLTTGGESRMAEGMFVSGGYFAALDGRPVAGRLIGPADDVRGCASPGAVISQSFWHREFGGAPDVVGREIRLDGQPIPIIGVVAAGFTGIEVGRRLDVFMPICARPLIKRTQPGIDQRDLWWLAAFGRLKPGVGLEAASAELAAKMRPMLEGTLPPRYAAPDVKSYFELVLQAFPASTGVSGLRARYGDSLTLLLSIAGLVLLIACANLANLMLARASARATEIAVRLAIGASRGRVFRQFIAESLLLAAIGGIGGVALALGLSKVLVAILTSDGSPWALDLRLDLRLTAFTVLLAVVTCLIFGLMPAWRATRTPPGVVMKLGGRGLTADRGRFLIRRALVVGQVAISLVLVVGALLLVGTLRNLAASSPGFTDRGVLVVEMDLRPAGVAPEGQRAFQQRVMERLRAIPGVRHAAAAAIVPVSGSGWNETLVIDGQEQPGHPDANRVSASFFSALDVPFVTGRNFDARDHIGAPPVAIVNDAFVAKYLSTGNPIGRVFSLRVGPGDPNYSYEVIGVVRNTKYRTLREDLGPIMFFADTQEPASTLIPFLTAILRTDGDVDALRPVATRAVADVHPSIAMTLDALETQVRNSLLRERLTAALSAGFAVLAVILAAVGLYGLMSYGVARRRNEIGIRVALGATRAGIAAMIVRETAVLVTMGAVAGLVGAVFAARAAKTLLYGLEPANAAALVAGVAILAIVAAVASLVPAHRAARLEPTMALRE